MIQGIPSIMVARRGPLAIKLIANVGAGSSDGNNATTAGIDTSGANFLVLVLSSYQVGVDAVISDSNSNVWIPLTAFTGITNPRVQIYYVSNPVVGSAHTFTVTSTGDFPAIAVAAFKNVNSSSPFDQENGAGGLGTTIQTGNVTPSENNELLIAGLCFEASGVVSIDSSFIITDTVDYTFGQHFGSSLAYKIQTILGAENPTFTHVNSDAAASIATFKN